MFESFPEFNFLNFLNYLTFWTFLIYAGVSEGNKNKLQRKEMQWYKKSNKNKK